MTLLDQVRKLEQEVVNRLKELEPLTREYEQLRKVAERLGLRYSPRSDTSAEEAGSTTARGGAATRASASTRSTRGGAKPQGSGRRAAAAATETPAAPRGAQSTRAQRGAGRAARASAPKTAATRGAPKATSRRSGRGRSAARPGQRLEDVRRLVAEQPGITVRQLGERLGVDPTGLYAVVRRLTEEGQLRKDGTSLHPVGSAAMAESDAGGAGAAQPPGPGTARAPEPTGAPKGESAATSADTGPAAEG